MSLTFTRKNVWEKLDEAQRKHVFETGDDYKNFIDASKTERLSAKEIIARAKTEGYKCICEFSELKAGDKVYYVNKEKAVVLALVGSLPVDKGLNIIGSHTDAPRIDIKAMPLYEEKGISLFKTHYYGGIRKYQWVTIPLALYGTIIKADGSKLDISIGDDPADPVFYISDLLPHLARRQSEKKIGDAIEGEELNIIVGSLPTDEKPEDKKAVKANILKLLNEKYGITEEDFTSAELEIVPAGAARDVGFDRSLIAAYGHDDRICAYTSMKALFETNGNERTAIALFADKEEVGSQGATGMHSDFFVNFIGEMISLQNNGDCGTMQLKRALASGAVLSADVAAGVDPTFPSVCEAMNAAYIGQGVAVVKYTGSRGKSGCNDANAEFAGKIRKVFNDAGVVWQTSELGKVDEGGGGTIAYILAKLNMDVIDVGVPVLSMHAPHELAAKTDIYMTYKGYKAFYENYK